jgi:hypothetical protein
VKGGDSMDKYIEVLCKQNPITKMDCGNPECKNEFEIKSNEFFKDKTYNRVCDKCGKSTQYDTSKFVEDFKKQLKQLGVIVK